MMNKFFLIVKITYLFTNQKNGQVNWIFKAENYSPFPPTINDEQILFSKF
jgi:hypothetical protein